MPQIPLVFGQMDLESDQTSKKDAVLAHLYNGFRVGQSIYMWPGLAEHCDLGTSKPAWSWLSILHGVHLAVSDGRLFRIVDSVPTEITGVTLTAGTPPTFAEDAHRIFIAANSEINFYAPGDSKAYVPRRVDVPPEVSALITVTTAKASLSFDYAQVDSVIATGAVIRYNVSAAEDAPYTAEISIDGVWSTLATNEAVGNHITFANLATGTHEVQLRVTAGEKTDLSDKLAIKVSANSSPVFSTAPTISNIQENTADVTYAVTDSGGEHYALHGSIDGGKTWEELLADNTPGSATKVYNITGLESGKQYNAILKAVSVSGNTTEICSPPVKFTTASTTVTETDSPLSFISQPVASAVTDKAFTLTYSTADICFYQSEYSIDGGANWVIAKSSEIPGDGKIIEVKGLDAGTAYQVRVRLVSKKYQTPSGVTSLAFVSGFLVADGTAGEGSLPGDFGYSDTQGADGVPTYSEWSYENNASKPDALQTIIATSDNNIYAIGTESVDISYLSGDASNPFASNKGAAQPFGTPSRYSIAYDAQNIYFLSVIGGNRQIIRLVGGREPQIIGFPVGVPIQDVEDITTARGFLMGFRGQSFYIITFPTAHVSIDDSHHNSLTLAFNIRSQEWSIIGGWDEPIAAYAAHIANSFAYDQQTRYIAAADGKIYTVVETDRTDEPVMLHRWRDNGNMAWREPRQVSLGKLGDRYSPIKQRQCGRYYKRQDEFIFVSGKTRMTIRTGWRNWGKTVEKISNQYVYDVKRGDSGIVFNGAEETIQPL